MSVTMLMHTSPQDRDDYGSVFARASKPRDCACNALSPNRRALHCLPVRNSEEGLIYDRT